MITESLSASEVALLFAMMLAPATLVVLAAILKGYEIRVTRPKQGKHEKSGV